MLNLTKISLVIISLALSLGITNISYAADTETDFNTHTGAPGPEAPQDNPQPDSTADDGGSYSGGYGSVNGGRSSANSGNTGCPTQGSSSKPSNSTNSPLYLANRQFVWREVDASFPGRLSLTVARTYNAFDGRDGIFGKGWTERCERSLVKASRLIEIVDSSTDPASVRRETTYEYVYRAASGRRYTFKFVNGSYQPPNGINNLSLLEIANGSVELVNLDGSKEVYNTQGLLTQEIDNNGNALNYEYLEGALTRISDTHGRFFTFTYDKSGHVAILTDHTGREWQYSYDESGALISVTNPEGGVRQYAYESYKPQASGATYALLTKITDASGVITTSVTYDTTGKVISYTEGENVNSYSVSGNYVYKSDSANSRWRYLLDDKGRKTEILEPTGHTIQYEYDEQGNRIKTVDQFLNAFTSEYDQYGRLVSTTTPDGTTKISYASISRFPSSVESPTGRRIDMTYDGNNNLISSKDPAGNISSFSYNSRGELIETTNALGEKLNFNYTNTGLIESITNKLGQVTSFSYDERGNQISETNAAGEKYQYTYDVMNRMSSSIDPLGRETSYTYDKAGRTLSITTPNGESVLYGYDEYGRLINRTDFDGVVESYTYRSDNLIAVQIDRAGIETQFTYDSAKRLSSVRKGSVSTSYTYDRRNMLTRARNETGIVGFTYDAMGRVIQEINNGTVDYVYNEEGELISQSAFRRDLQYDYDVRGLLSKLIAPSGAFDFTYDALDRRTNLQYPNGDRTTYKFDAIGQLTEQSHSGSFSAVYQYNFDEANRLTQWQGDGTAKTYQYNAASEIIDVLDNFGAYSFTYDEMGNRTSDGGQFDENNRLLENESHRFSYDANGNLITKFNKTTGQFTKYSWNERNQLVKFEQYADESASLADSSTTYSYGPLGRRWSKVKDNKIEYFSYSGMDRIATLDSRKQPIEHFDFGPGIDEPFVLEKDSTPYFYFTDYLGSVKAITDGSSVISSYDYSAYGQTEVSGDETLNPYRYTGRESEEEDLYYYRARYYDPDLGRFISSDPIGLGGGVNTYTYGFGNPLSNKDPTGLVPIPAAIGLCLANPICRTLATQLSRQLGITIADAAIRAAIRLGIIAVPNQEEKNYCELQGDDCEQEREYCHPICVDKCVGVGLTDAPLCYRRCMRECLPTNCASNY